MSKDELVARAQDRWRAAAESFRAGDGTSGWVNLLAMGMDMAAAQDRELSEDLISIGRLGGLFP